MRVWNSQVQTWLRHYVTTPMIDKSLPKDAIQVVPIAGTLIICGAWHGFYIGYQMMFMSSALFAIALKFWYRTELFATIDSSVPWVILKPFKMLIG